MRAFLLYLNSVRAFFADPQNIVHLIGYASILSAALFGMFGLFTEYKKDGKITVWGRIAAGGIALSAVFAMTSSVIQGRISADKAETERKAAARANAEERRKFQIELDNFGHLNRNLQKSLVNAQKNIELTTALGAQERENTGHVMRSLWDDANRITPGSFEVEVDYTCHTPDETRPPLVMPEGSIAEIGISNGKLARAQKMPLNLFATERLIQTRTYLVSVDQRISLIRLGHIGSTDWKQVSQFSAFVAGGDNAGNVSVDLGHFADPREWRDAAIEVIVRSAQPGIADRMFESFGWAAKDDFAKDLMSMENAGWTYTFPPDMGRGTWRALPCSVGMKVRVNHRIVATGLASVIQPKGEANDRAGVVVVKFPVVMAVPNALPQYSDIRGPTAAR